jgi:maleylacetoacetate isomerase
MSESATKKQKTEAPVLYGYWRSGSSWRVRIAMAWKNMDYDQSPVNLLKGEQRGDDFTARNPQQLLPSITIDGLSINQSPAILEYLEETRPEPAMLPKDPATRAKIRSVCMIIGCDIHPVQNLRVMKRVRDLLLCYFDTR